jgi:hypothetical protein
LIASENFVSRAVLEAAGSVLTNKYAEGYPGRAITADVSSSTSWSARLSCAPKRCSAPTTLTCKPHSGAQANMSVCLALLKPGDVVLGHEPRARRAPHARPSAQLLRHALYHRAVRCPQGRRADRLRRTRPARRGTKAEADHRRSQRLSAIIDFERSGRRPIASARS